jgi:SAM-dependent methyltransferase
VVFAKFWAKTVLYRVTPGGFGYCRRLRARQDPRYDHGRDMHSVRRKHNASTGWDEADEHGLRTRRYESYDEYVVHQRQKLDEMLKLHGGLANSAVAAYRRKFFRRFRPLVGLLPRSATILCLGARLGTEVEVLRDLGFANARGIDLNPGPENPFVDVGDFHHLDAGEASVDLVYTNCVDHAFELDAFFDEQQRVLKPDAYALYDFPTTNAGSDAAFESVVWADDEVVLEKIVPRFREVVLRERDGAWEWLLLRGKASAS